MANRNLESISGWDLLLGLSLLGIVVGAYFAFVPAKTRPSRTPNAQKSLRDAERDHRTLVAQVNEMRQSVNDRTWSVAPEAVGARMMDRLTHLAESHHVQLANFQVGRTIEAASLIQTPFVVTLQGDFAEVMRTIREIEDPHTRIAVGGLKLEPAKTIGTAANTVSTTLNLTAFLYKEEI